MRNSKLRIGIVLASIPGYSETFFRSKIVSLQNVGYEVILFAGNGIEQTKFVCPVVMQPSISKQTLIRVLQSTGILFKTLFKAPRASIRLIIFAKRNGYSLSKALRAVVIGSSILPFKLDWIHFGFASSGLQREFIGKAICAKVAVSFRGYDINQKTIRDEKVYQLLWENIDKVHSISRYLYYKARNLGLKENIPFEIISPAIDTSAFSLKSENRNKNTILLVSRLHWIKGIEYVLTAISFLVKRDLNVTIAGAGAELERLIFAAHQLGIEKKVKFIGKVNRNQVIDLMNTHEIFIQYSNQEGFCNSALEAQACGMLCIVSDAEGLQENVLDGQTGWVVPKRRPYALALKIDEVLGLKPQEKETVTNSARLRVLSEFNLQKQKNEFVDFYSDL